MIPWYRQKTTWTCIAAIVGAVGAYLTGEITLFACLQAVLIAIGGIFLRQGVEKSKVQ